jgi:hypothetical protein
VKLSDFIWLADREHNLDLHLVPMVDDTAQLCAEIRGLFVQTMINYGYTGYDFEIDSAFHRNSVYFAITRPELGIMMTGRITRPTSQGLPFEIGLRADGSSYHRTKPESVLDVNTYTYLPGQYQMAMPLLCAGFCRYLKLADAQRSFCLYDLDNRKIERAYHQIGFVPSQEFPNPIYFPTFERLIGNSRVPVYWRIMEWAPESLEEHATRSDSLVVADLHPLVQLPYLASRSPR